MIHLSQLTWPSAIALAILLVAAIAGTRWAGGQVRCASYNDLAGEAIVHPIDDRSCLVAYCLLSSEMRLGRRVLGRPRHGDTRNRSKMYYTVGHSQIWPWPYTTELPPSSNTVHANY